MGDWKESDGPWPFEKQPDKPTYNEGDSITYRVNPVWSMEEGSNVPITPTHIPCGYWFNGAVKDFCDWNFLNYTLKNNNDQKNSFITLITSGSFCFNSDEVWHLIDGYNDVWEPINSISYNYNWAIFEQLTDINPQSNTDIKYAIEELEVYIGNTDVITGYTFHVPWYWDISDDTITPRNAVLPCGSPEGDVLKIYKKAQNEGAVTATVIDVGPPKVYETRNAAGNFLKDLPYNPNVGGIPFQNVKIMPADASGLPAFGGTPDDVGLIQGISRVVDKGYKFNFMAFTEVIDPPVVTKPWRGVLLPTIKTIPQLLDGIKTQCIFYANLLVANNLKPYIFMTSSEMKLVNQHKTYTVGGKHTDLTGDFNFTAIAKWKEIYDSVKAIFNAAGWADVIVGYSADWSEYNGFGDNYGYWWRPLDELFMHQDAVLLDAYFGVTEQASSDYQEYYDGWLSGRDWDYFVSDYNAWKNYQGGTSPITSREYAAKDVNYWLNNYHYHVGLAPYWPKTQTEWIPNAKKIFFMEIGCPSVDSGGTEPNLFFDPHAVQGGIPRGSRLLPSIGTQCRYMRSFCDHARQGNIPVFGFSVWQGDSRPLSMLLTWGTGFWGDAYRVPLVHWMKYLR